MRTAYKTILVAIIAAIGGAAQASDLQVQPAIIDVAAPQAATAVSLSTSGPEGADVQVRVFRWTQENGVERLEPTRDVVASPPAAKVQAGKDYVVRLVRVTKRPVAGEESYRLLIDQLPSRAKPRSGTIKLLVRHSLPVFFADPATDGSSVKWSVVRSGDDVIVSATNAGGKRVRVSALSLKDDKGRSISLGKGLVGYVLGNSTMSWKAEGAARNFARKGTVKLSAQGYEGPISARVPIANRG